MSTGRLNGRSAVTIAVQPIKIFILLGASVPVAAVQSLVGSGLYGVMLRFIS